MNETRLCGLDDIPDGGSNGFALMRDGKQTLVLTVRRGDQVLVYYNSCPHTGGPLDFKPGRFLSLDKRHIQCSTHGALFRLEDGRCIFGPCAGEALRPVESTIRGGAVYVKA